MYKTIWNYISKHSKKSSTASVFLPVLVLEWTVLGLFAGALICLFLHNTTALVKATIVLCSGGYAGLIFGFLGGIFYIYKDAASLPHNATSNIIISVNPTAKKIVPIFECSPADISGISSSTTT